MNTDFLYFIKPRYVGQNILKINHNYKMKTFLKLTTVFIVFLSACNWAKEKTKESIHKTGEIVAKTGSEFADGIKEGVNESFSNIIKLSDSLGRSGIKLGKVLITGTDSTSDNIVTAYIIFEKGYEGKLIAKAFDENGVEFGRASVMVTAEPDDAKYYDFQFDHRTNIDRNDKVVIY